MDQTKSKGLDAFEILKQDIGKCYKEEMLIVEKELKDYESYKVFLDNVEKGKVTYTPRDIWEEERKKLKALEVIKNKKVDVAILFEKSCARHRERLTQEEYDLLKEVLK